MKSLPIVSTLLATTVIVGGSFAGAVQPANADTETTAAIIAAAGAIVGALIVDSNNHPYYVNNGKRYYVTQNEANYWKKQHGPVVRRNAYVPEQRYPVARNPYNNGNQHH